MNTIKTIVNGLVSKMNGCAKKSEVYKKSETYDKGAIDKKITKLDKSLSDVAKSGNYYDLNDIPEIPSDDHINELITTALGVVENGTY